jgi:hypothetical protein
MSDYQKPMAHEEAERTHAVESYLLNELTEAERLRFEEHYFECNECADAVVAGQVFVRGIRPSDSWGKRLVARLSDPVPVPAWRLWAAGGAMAASLALYTAQTLNAPPIALANTVLLAKEDEKDAEQMTSASLLTTPSATIEIDLSGPEFPFYRMTVFRDKRDIISKVLASPADRSSHKLSLQVSARALGIGAFTVSLAGLGAADSTSAQPLGTYHFFVSPSK